MRRQPINAHGWGFAWGGVILFIGVALLLDHMGVISAAGLWRFWPMIMVLAGIVNLLNECRRIWGVMLLTAGILLQLGEFHVINLTWDLLWPLMVIFAGVMIMWGSIRARRTLEARGDVPQGPGTLNEIAVFSGIEKRVSNKNFSGGRIVAIFGGVELDLWQAEIEGDTAILQIDAIFGGVEIRVPDTWIILSEGQGIFGGYTDSTHQHPPEDPAKPSKTLILRGAAIFGGVELRN